MAEAHVTASATACGQRLRRPTDRLRIRPLAVTLRRPRQRGLRAVRRSSSRAPSRTEPEPAPSEVA